MDVKVLRKNYHRLLTMDVADVFTRLGVYACKLL